MGKLGSLCTSIGLGFLANMLLGGGNDKQKSDIDNSVVEPAVRGTICPLSMGSNRYTPILAYVGDTLVIRTESDSGGKGGGGGDGQESITYEQSGMHILSVGEGSVLSRIYESGKVIFDTEITSSSHPSGTQLTASDGSVFRVYWGEDGQPIDSALASLTGVNSRYPYMFYIIWNRKKLGGSKSWPAVEYDAFVKPQQDTLFGKDPIIDETIDSFDVAVSVTALDEIFVPSSFGGYYTNESVITTTAAAAADIEVGYQLSGTINGLEHTATVSGISESGGTYTIRTQALIPSTWYGGSGTLAFKAGVSRGVNPAAMIYQLLFETYPHGLGEDPDFYNLTDLESVFDYFATAGRKFPGSMLLKSSKSVRDGLGLIMQDAGISIAWDMVTAQVRFIKASSADSPVLINTEFYSIKKGAKKTTGYAVLEPALRTYRFKDSNRNYKYSTILNTDDGLSKYSGAPHTKKITMGIVRDLATASQVAAYRDRENAVRTKISTTLSKEVVGSLVGGLFNLQGIAGNWRLSDKTVIPDKSPVKAVFVKDAYSEETSFVEKSASGLTPQDSAGAQEDVIVRFLEVNRFTNPDENGVIIVRVRQSPQIIGTVPYLSDSDVSYLPFSSSEYYASGGKLSQEILEDGPAIDTSNYTFTISGPDASSVVDLTASEDEDRWRSGEQVCLIGSELFFLRGITPTATPGEYQLEDLIRARIGTVREAHSVSDEIIIFRLADITLLKATFLNAGATVYGKSVPFTQVDTVDISDITADSLTYQGGGYRPLQPINLNTEDSTGGMPTGVDTTFVWSYKNVTGGAGAGLGLSDEPYNNPLPEGYFKLEFLTTGGTVERTVNNISLGTYEYTSANRASDFGGSDFKVRVYNVLNGLESEYDELEVEVV